MRNLRQLIRRSGLLSSEKRRRRSEKLRQGASPTHRRLSNETLEKRELLAGDIGLVANHNYWNPYDVNDDLRISASDALGIINHMSRGGEGEQQHGQSDMFYDVNGDGNTTAADALGVINALGRGEGEEIGDLIELSVTARDDNDVALPVDANGVVTVDVGEPFWLEISYDDLRENQIFQPPIRLGAFGLYADIGVANPGVLQPILNESQVLFIGSAIVEEPFASGLQFGIEGSSDTYFSDFNSFFSSEASRTTEFETMLMELGGYSPDQYTLTEFEVQDNDETPNEDESGFAYRITWVGNEFGNVDLPDLTIDVLENGGPDVPATFTAIDAFLADGVTPNTEAVRFNLNTLSRTYNATVTNPQGENFYNTQKRGGFDSTGFVGVGGLGQVPLEGGGIPDLTDDGFFETPFDVVSVRVFMNQPVNGLVVGVNPGEAREATLLYGRDTPIPQENILIDDVMDTNGNGVVSFITINAVGDAPNFSPTISIESGDADVGGVTEIADGGAGENIDALNVAGSVTFRDSNLIDAHTVGFTVPGGSNYLGDFQTSIVTPATGGMDGKIDWSFAVNDADVDFLAEGQTLTQFYTLRVEDDLGASATQVIEVTITGRNDGPVLEVNVANGDTAAGGVTELIDGAPGENSETLTDDGTLTLLDVDLTDTHTVTAVPVGSGYRGTLNATVTEDSTGDGVGKVTWTYSVNDADLEDLEEGQQLSQSYDVIVQDNQGATHTQRVEITVTGSEDPIPNTPPEITVESGDSVAASVSELSSNSAVPALQSTTTLGSSVPVPTNGGAGWTFGWQFTVGTEDISVTELGGFLGGGTSAQVAIWQVGSSSQPIVPVTNISSSDPNSGGYHYASVQPVTLNSGGTYRIGQRFGFQSTTSFVGYAPAGDTALNSSALSGFEAYYTASLTPPTGIGYPNTPTSNLASSFASVGPTFQFRPVSSVSGTLSFTDAEVEDAHTVSSEADGTDYAGEFSVAVTDAATGDGNGALAWAFDVSDADLDFLKDGENLDQIYTITITDDNNGSDTEKVTVTLVGSNDSPESDGPLGKSYVTSNPSDTFSLLEGVTDVDGDILSVTIDSTTPGEPIDGVTINGSDVTVDPSAYDNLDAGQSEVITINYTVADPFGASISRVATITVQGLNDPPTVGDPIQLMFNEDDGQSSVDLLAGASDPEGDPLSIVVDSVTGNDAGVEVVGTNANINPSAYDSLPAGGEETVVVNYRVLDGIQGNEASQTATFIFTGENDAASISGATTGAMTEDAAGASGVLSVSDVDQGENVFQPQSSVPGIYGVFSIDEQGSWTYTRTSELNSMNEGDELTDSFQVSSADGTATETVVVTITGENDAASISGATTGAMTEDAAGASGVLNVSDVDDGENVFQPQSSVPGTYGVFSIDEQGNWTYTRTSDLNSMNQGDELTDSFQVTSADGTAMETVVVTITGENDAASISGDPTRMMTEDAAGASGVLSVSDVDEGENVFQPQNSVTGTYGVFSIDEQGSWTYTKTSDLNFLKPGDELTDSFQVSSADGTAIETVVVTITGENDNPVANDDPDAIAYTNGTSTIVVLDNDNAGGGEDQGISVLEASSDSGVVVINSDGTLSFTPDSSVVAPTTVTIEYKIQDELGAESNTGVVTVQVLDFIPSTLSGFVHLDHVENIQEVMNNGAEPFRNGVKDEDEDGFGGIEMRLVSTSNATGSPIDKTVLTDIHGRYSFEGVAPGEYKVVFEWPDTVIYLGTGEYEISISSEGGVTRDNLNFSILGTQGSALSNVDILASSYLRTNATMMQISDGGREGGLASLEPNGELGFIQIGAGYEDVIFAELVTNAAMDEALLTIVEEDGDVLSARLSTEYFVCTPDGMGVEWFGGTNDLNFAESTVDYSQEFDDYGKAIDDFFNGYN